MSRVFQPQSTGSGGSSSAPGKNYLSSITTSNGTNNGNGNFELGATTGWALGTIGTLTNGLPTGSPTFGSGASGNLSIAIVSNQLAGASSLSYASSAASTQGNMLASSSFFIDSEDQAKVLTWKFYYTANSGTANCNFSGTSSNSFGVAVYDVTNSAFLATTGAFSMTQGSGIGYATGVVQTASSTTQLRFIVYNANATSGAATIYFDDFQIGPQTAPFGPAMTDWTSFTPTGSWSTNSTFTGYWRRVGGDMEAQVNIALAGAPTSAALTVNLPTGYSIDTNRLTNSTTGANRLGIGGGKSAGGFVTFLVGYNSTSSVELRYQSSITATASTVTQAAPATFASGDNVAFWFKVPIAGWSSNVLMSNDTDTRVVAAQIGLANGYATGGAAVIKFDTVVIDTHSGYSTSTGLYTVPVSGFYQVSATVRSATAGTDILLNVNSSNKLVLCDTNVANDSIGGSQIVKCNAGDTIAVFTGGSITVSGSAGIPSSVSILRLTGPSVVAATESVELIYTGYSSGITGTSNATVIYSTKIKDTHNGYSAGTYTVPVSGAYQVEAGLLLATSGSPVVGTTLADIQIIQAGSASTTYECKYFVPTTNTTIAAAGFPVAASGIMYCLAGDTIKVQGSVNLATASGAASSTMNYFSLVRVGN